MEQQHPLNNKEAKEKAAVDRQAIKASYKKLQNELSSVDLVNHLKTCYNTYNEASGGIQLPTHLRLSYLDKANTIKEILDYIERQRA